MILLMEEEQSTEMAKELPIEDRLRRKMGNSSHLLKAQISTILQNMSPLLDVIQYHHMRPPKKP